ncbi:hypothetical protein EUX98_g2958 [Antrodiella citrinella]|uniref:Uncharacterized protein n=1 Tax=Antrodiella citrinella TaxID=2447956 RepID=A0A4S4MZY0_9APHY|nr:hypothetical protein EUX98_g2958 [Antrodiella citrinella]
MIPTGIEDITESEKRILIYSRRLQAALDANLDRNNLTHQQKLAEELTAALKIQRIDRLCRIPYYLAKAVLTAGSHGHLTKQLLAEDNRLVEESQTGIRVYIDDGMVIEEDQELRELANRNTWWIAVVETTSGRLANAPTRGASKAIRHPWGRALPAPQAVVADGSDNEQLPSDDDDVIEIPAPSGMSKRTWKQSVSAPLIKKQRKSHKKENMDHRFDHLHVYGTAVNTYLLDPVQRYKYNCIGGPKFTSAIDCANCRKSKQCSLSPRGEGNAKIVVSPQATCFLIVFHYDLKVKKANSDDIPQATRGPVVPYLPTGYLQRKFEQKPINWEFQVGTEEAVDDDVSSDEDESNALEHGASSHSNSAGEWCSATSSIEFVR